MAAALVSALSGRPAKAGLAMTGEITLSGRVLPIGGVKEKVLGAVRAGIREIVLPNQNEADLEDLPAEVRESLIVHPVEGIGRSTGGGAARRPVRRRTPAVRGRRPGTGPALVLQLAGC